MDAIIAVSKTPLLSTKIAYYRSISEIQHLDAALPLHKPVILTQCQYKSYIKDEGDGKYTVLNAYVPTAGGITNTRA